MTKKWHHVRILESTYEYIKDIQKEFESDAETIDRIAKVHKELPNKYKVIAWG